MIHVGNIFTYKSNVQHLTLSCLLVLFVVFVAFTGKLLGCLTNMSSIFKTIFIFNYSYLLYTRLRYLQICSRDDFQSKLIIWIASTWTAFNIVLWTIDSSNHLTFWFTLTIFSFVGQLNEMLWMKENRRYWFFKEAYCSFTVSLQYRYPCRQLVIALYW